MNIPVTPSSATIRYLGGRFNLDLNWKTPKKEMLQSIRFQMTQLYPKKLTLLETLSVATTMVQGQAGYYLQLGPFGLTDMLKLDTQLDGLLRFRSGLPKGTPMNLLHAPRSRGGMGVFKFHDLLISAQTTELLVRLSTPGVVGEVARARWRACQSAVLDHMPSSTSPSPKHSLTLHTLWLAARFGYSVVDGSDLDDVAALHADSPLIHHHVDGLFLPKLEALRIRFMHQLCADGEFRPWDHVSRSVRPEPQWFRDLKAKHANLPNAIIPPPPKPDPPTSDWAPLPLEPPPTGRG